MGRKSVAARILENLEKDHDQEGSFILVYDFPASARPQPEFYNNLQRIFEALGDGVRVQKSTIRFKTLKAARAVGHLCRHYDSKVLLFKGEEIESF